jgi:deoxyribose-phosphate aldolase
MDIKQYLDSTYLKTAAQAGLTDEQNLEVVKSTVAEAIAEKFKLVMIRPEMVRMARTMVSDAGSGVLVGTVIDFPHGNASLKHKLTEAQQAINYGADELDFVLDYDAAKTGNTEKIKEEVLECTTLGLSSGKTVKWIIETAALDNLQIVQLSALVKNVMLDNFPAEEYSRVFVKSSTGFYKTPDSSPNGATIEAVKLMIENAYPLPVKASGGVRTYEEAMDMIRLGVKRIGTSSAKAIADRGSATGDY